jgi:hypothetical protein
LRFLFRDAFGLLVSEGALMNMFIRSHAGFKIEADKAKAILREAKVVASDETGVRIEGTNSYHWVFLQPNGTVALILPSLNNLKTIRYNTIKYYDDAISSASRNSSSARRKPAEKVAVKRRRG